MSCSEGCACSLELPPPSDDSVTLSAPREEWEALVAFLAHDALGVTERGLQVGRLYNRIAQALKETV
jgi:hypothetical protein